MQQQPYSVGEGLQNLLNNTVLNDFSCNITTFPNFTTSPSVNPNHNKVECVSATETIRLITLPCNSSIGVVVVEDNGATLLDETLFSMQHQQTLSYTNPAGDSHHLNISIQVVVGARDGREYYIVMLESSLGLQFQMAAIPLICIQFGNY